MNDPRWASIDAFAEENRDNILRDITRLVAGPRVAGEAAPGAPFGPEHTDLPLPEFAGPMHGANEGANFDKLIEALKIYILALLRLQEIEL